jgi:hypothetical protein
MERLPVALRETVPLATRPVEQRAIMGVALLPDDGNNPLICSATRGQRARSRPLEVHTPLTFTPH